MARLGVNIESIAMLRENGVRNADPLAMAMLAEVGGADGIVCPVQEQMKIVTERDLRLLKEIVKTHLNVQVPPEESLINTALSVQPDMITLIPGKKPGSTAGGGLDILGQSSLLTKWIQEIRNRDTVVSILVEPNIHQVKAALKAGVDYVELHLGLYTEAEDLGARNDQLENLQSVAIAAQKLGLGVSAGQGADFHNVMAVSVIEAIEEINIGRAIVSRALSIGMEAAVRDMVALVH
jgi:pyridoxine 5-phosphate synthase